MAKAFIAAFHIVIVTFVFVFVGTCIVENKVLLLQKFFIMKCQSPTIGMQWCLWKKRQVLQNCVPFYQDC